MGKQVIISISREFGSGGRAIAEQIAKDMGLKLYERNILEEMAKEMQINADGFAHLDEKPKKFVITRRVREHSSSMEETFAQMQFDFIRKKADEGESFVVLGRCSEHVLKGRDSLISIFVLGDKPQKIERVMEIYNLDREEAIQKMKRHDKSRKQYHNEHCDDKWGDSRAYDMCINSSKLGIGQTTKFLEEYIKERTQFTEV